MKIFNFFIVVFFFLLGCNNHSDVEVLAKKITSKLNDWELKSVVSVTESKEHNLDVHILFKKDEFNSLDSYFLDKESNKIVVTMLSESFYESLKKYNKINYHLNFENTNDGKPYTVSVNFNEIEKTHHKFKGCPKFYAFIEYAFKNIKSVDVVRCNTWIAYLNSKSDLFNFKGSFWLLLYNYSIAIDNPREHLKSVYLFIAFTSVVVDPENPRDDDINQENLKYYIQEGGFDMDLIYLSLPNLINKLDEKYGK